MTTVVVEPVPVPIEREFTVRSRSQFQHAVRRFVRNPLAMGGLVTFVLMMLAAFGGPHLFSTTGSTSRAPRCRRRRARTATSSAPTPSAGTCSC